MLKPPADPFALQARFMAAMCADLSDLANFKRDGFARTEALRAVVGKTAMIHSALGTGE